MYSVHQSGRLVGELP